MTKLLRAQRWRTLALHAGHKHPIVVNQRERPRVGDHNVVRLHIAMGEGLTAQVSC